MTAEIRSAKELHHILSSEADVIRELVVITEREQEALQKEDLADLANAIRDKEITLQELAQREQLREDVVARLAKVLGLSAEASLPDIIARLDEIPTLHEGLKAKVVALHEEFVFLMERLLTLNYGNRSILESGLHRINATFDYLAAAIATPEGQRYTATGNNQPQPRAAAGKMLNWQI